MVNAEIARAIRLFHPFPDMSEYKNFNVRESIVHTEILLPRFIGLYIFYRK